MMDLIEIKAPSLINVEQAEDFDGVFNNINENFKALSNHEFIRGRDAKVNYETSKAYEYQQEIEQALSVHWGEIFKIQSGKIIKLKSWHSNLKFDKITVIKNENEEIVSSLPYIYKDPRFIDIDSSFDYQDATELSCVIVFSDGKWQAISSFPTLYYNNKLGELCWKYFGNNTNIPAAGPKGKDGKDAKLYIGKCIDLDEKTGQAKLTGILSPIDGAAWVSPDDSVVGESILVYDEHQNAYLSLVFKTDDNYYVHCTTDNKFNTDVPSIVNNDIEFKKKVKFSGPIEFDTGAKVETRIFEFNYLYNINGEKIKGELTYCKEGNVCNLNMEFDLSMFSTKSGNVYILHSGVKVIGDSVTSSTAINNIILPKPKITQYIPIYSKITLQNRNRGYIIFRINPIDGILYIDSYSDTEFLGDYNIGETKKTEKIKISISYLCE